MRRIKFSTDRDQATSIYGTVLCTSGLPRTSNTCCTSRPKLRVVVRYLHETRHAIKNLPPLQHVCEATDLAAPFSHSCSERHLTHAYTVLDRHYGHFCHPPHVHPQVVLSDIRQERRGTLRSLTYARLVMCLTKNSSGTRIS